MGLQISCGGEGRGGTLVVVVVVLVVVVVVVVVFSASRARWTINRWFASHRKTGRVTISAGRRGGQDSITGEGNYQVTASVRAGNQYLVYCFIILSCHGRWTRVSLGKNFHSRRFTSPHVPCLQLFTLQPQVFISHIHLSCSTQHPSHRLPYTPSSTPRHTSSAHTSASHSLPPELLH